MRVLIRRTILAGAFTGALVCLVLQWPPWNPPVSGDALMGSYYWMMIASHPLYLLTGGAATAFASATGYPLVVRALLNVQVILNCIVVALALLGAYRLTRRLVA